MQSVCGYGRAVVAVVLWLRSYCGGGRAAVAVVQRPGRAAVDVVFNAAIAVDASAAVNAAVVVDTAIER